jgi:hypothetical protein
MEQLTHAPLYLAAFLMDAAIFFLIIRLMTHILPVQPLMLRDRVGSVGVESVTKGIYRVVERWCARPLSPRQQEGVALFILALHRLDCSFGYGMKWEVRSCRNQALVVLRICVE